MATNRPFCAPSWFFSKTVVRCAAVISNYKRFSRWRCDESIGDCVVWENGMKYIYAAALTAACLVASTAHPMSEVQNAITAGDRDILQQKINELKNTPQGKALIAGKLGEWIQSAQAKKDAEAQMLRDGGLGVSRAWGYSSAVAAVGCGGVGAYCYQPTKEQKNAGTTYTGKQVAAGATGAAVGVAILIATCQSNGAQQNAENRKANYTSIVAYLQGLHTAYPAPRPGTASSLAASARTIRERDNEIADLTRRLAALEGR